MNDIVRKVFDMLGVEPNEKFKIIDSNCEYCIDSELDVYCFACNDKIKLNGDKWSLRDLLVNPKLIIKLPKEQNKIKKKLRDLTPEEWDKWRRKNCGNCRKCFFKNVVCNMRDYSWVNHKDLYSDKFLNQEIEVE